MYMIRCFDKTSVYEKTLLFCWNLILNFEMK